MVDSNLYINENAWLDLTSSWCIKDIVKRYKNFHEMSYTGSASLVWVIMDLKAEDLRGKNNAFRVPVYLSSDWRKMVSLGTFTTNDMQRKDATSGEETQPPPQPPSKNKGRK